MNVRRWSHAAKPRCYHCGGILEPSETTREKHANHADYKKHQEVSTSSTSKLSRRGPLREDDYDDDYEEY